MDNDREAFEKYAVSNEMDITRADNLNKNYSFPMVQFIWAGFQAARALDAERIKELENKVKFYERWLEKGVYFTPAEYAKELEKLAAAEASIKLKDKALLLIRDSTYRSALMLRGIAEQALSTTPSDKGETNG